ncbi:MAG: CBS domain-containing protein [Clostridiales bacterium]|nr:CBS domain-containing protein [Clostridiales bacterium]
MNIIKIMIPKISTVFLHENDTVRQGLERFRAHGYTAIPDILAVGNTDLKFQERYRIGDIMRKECYLALSIDADEKQVIAVALNQNYVPIVDGRGALCGIITRQSLIHYFENQRNA